MIYNSILCIAVLLTACTSTTEVKHIRCDAIIHQHIDSIPPDTIRIVFDSVQFVNCEDV